jgi:hypothetical protein
MMKGGFSNIAGRDVWVIKGHNVPSAGRGAVVAPDESVFFTRAQKREPLTRLQVTHKFFHLSPLICLRVSLAYK